MKTGTLAFRKRYSLTCRNFARYSGKGVDLKYSINTGDLTFLTRLRNACYASLRHRLNADMLQLTVDLTNLILEIKTNPDLERTEASNKRKPPTPKEEAEVVASKADKK